MRRYGEKLSSLLLTMWVGGLWVVGYLVVPVLFSSLDRMLAGAVAGKLFELIAWLGLLVSALLLLFSVHSQRRLMWQAPVIWLLCSMACLTALQLFLIQPEIARMKLLAVQSAPELGPGSAIFARWHAGASLVYLLQSLLGIGLVLWSERLFKR